MVVGNFHNIAYFGSEEKIKDVNGAEKIIDKSTFKEYSIYNDPTDFFKKIGLDIYIVKYSGINLVVKRGEILKGEKYNPYFLTLNGMYITGAEGIIFDNSKGELDRLGLPDILSKIKYISKNTRKIVIGLDAPKDFKKFDNLDNALDYLASSLKNGNVNK